MRSIGWRPFPNGTRRKAEWQRLLCGVGLLKILFPNPERKLKVTVGIPLQKRFQDPRDWSEASKCPPSLPPSLSYACVWVCGCIHLHGHLWRSELGCWSSSSALNLVFLNQVLTTESGAHWFFWPWRSEAASMCHQAWLFMWVLGVELTSLCLGEALCQCRHVP